MNRIILPLLLLVSSSAIADLSLTLQGFGQNGTDSHRTGSLIVASQSDAVLSDVIIVMNLYAERGGTHNSDSIDNRCMLSRQGTGVSFVDYATPGPESLRLKIPTLYPGEKVQLLIDWAAGYAPVRYVEAKARAENGDSITQNWSSDNGITSPDSPLEALKKIRLNATGWDTCRREERLRVAIDPGHGGDDVGVDDGSGLLEKDVTLRFARAIEQMLKDDPDVSVRLTREDDRTLSTRERLDEIDDADLFITLHAEGFRALKPHGVHLTIPSRRCILPPRVGDATTEMDKAKMQRVSHSRYVAEQLRAGLQDIQQDSEPVKLSSACFQVLKRTPMPGIWLTLGYLTNPQDRERLNDEYFEAEVAKRVSDVLRDLTARYRSYPMAGY